MQNFIKYYVIFPAFFMLLIFQFSGCKSQESNEKTSFINIGGFTVNRISSGLTEVKDGSGRTFALIPRGQKAPDGYEKYQVIHVPVKRVVAYGSFEVATLRALGVVEDVLVGVTTPEKDWYVPDIKKGVHDGRIAFLGSYNAIDFERLKNQQPELVLTWDNSIIPMLEELGIPCVITTTPVAMCLNARMRFVQFMAPFFNREDEADEFFNRVNQALIRIREKAKHAEKKPKVMWGDIYEKRVLVEPGNAWVGELVELIQSDYLFEDVYGTSCIEISIERFLSSGEDADIFFTYRTPKDGATSRAALARLNPIIADIRPLKSGRVYSPLPHYSQSGDKLDEILEEIAAIIHPELYPGYRLRYFLKLPDKDPKNEIIKKELTL